MQLRNRYLLKTLGSSGIVFLSPVLQNYLQFLVLGFDMNQGLVVPDKIYQTGSTRQDLPDRTHKIGPTCLSIHPPHQPSLALRFLIFFIVFNLKILFAK